MNLQITMFALTLNICGAFSQPLYRIRCVKKLYVKQNESNVIQYKNNIQMLHHCESRYIQLAMHFGK